MDFIANYWVILLVAFILFLLVLLSYLIDKEIRKMKDNDGIADTDSDSDNIDSKLNADLEEYCDNDTDDEKNKEDFSVVDNSSDDKLEEEELVDDSSEILDYDELDVEDIDDEFNKVIHKKKLIDNTIKDSVEAMKVDELDIKKKFDEDRIELPDIKIKKDTNEDIWKK